jgi:OOP family OmpA-OmpF porin
MNVRLVSRSVAAALLAGAAVTAQAQWYVGGGLGYAKGKFDGADFDPSNVQQILNQDLVSLGFPGTAVLNGSSDDNDIGWKVFAGYRFNQWFGVEGSYVDLGTFKYDYSGSYQGLSGTGAVKYEAYSWNLAGVARYPFGNGFSVQAKAGAAFTNAKNEFSLTIGPVNDSGSEKKSNTNFLWGLGAGYDFTPNLGMLLEYENFGEFGDADNTGRVKVDLWSASLLYKF